MIRFLWPEAFLLVPIVLLALRGRLWPRPLPGVLRVLLLVAVAALLARPAWQGVADGRDVVLVVDRSASMPTESLAQARELATEIAAAMPAGDRLGVVTFGQKPVLDSAPQAPFAWPEAARPIDPDGSDLAAAITTALSLIPPGRRGSLLVISDGEHTSSDLDAAARACRRQGVRADVVHLPRPAGVDCAVVEVGVPATIAAGEPFVAAAVVVAQGGGSAQWRLLCDGVVAQRGEVELQDGRNVLQFRHALDEPGQHEFAIEVERDGDVCPSNDRATAVVRVQSAPRFLCVTPKGRDDRLTAALRTAGFDVVVTAPERAPLSLAQLDGFRAVVLEDVAAGDLPAGGMRALAQWVRDLGGGVLMTGGKSSFGVGGYHRSPVEEVLPVTMEIREEQRKFGLAMAIALDVSGSMRADAGGEPKIALATRGVAGAIDLLSPIDAVSLLAVDTAAHVVVPLTAVTAKPELMARARAIDVGGGGIYVGEALHAAAEELAKATQQHKHLVLFADASDAEQPGDFETFVPALVAQGITVSVIAVGSASDQDAELLLRIAQLGQGRCQFVADATELPRVFAQETIQVARSSVVEAPTTISVLPPLAALGDMPTTFPVVGGYAMAWARPRAEVAMATADAQHAPFLAHWHIGLGRGAAFLGELDGALSGELATWDQCGDFLATLVRWLGGGQTGGMFATSRVEGGVGVFTLEVEAERAGELDALRSTLSPPNGPSREMAWERLSSGRMEARVPLLHTGTWRAAVQLGTESMALPPVCLPYSPEFRLQADARAGERELRGLARATVGHFGPNAASVLAGERRSTGAIDLGPMLAWVLVGLLLAEITVRRLQITVPMPRWLVRLWPQRGPQPATVVVVSPPPSPTADAAPGEAAGLPADEGMLGALSRAKRRTQGR